MPIEVVVDKGDADVAFDVFDLWSNVNFDDATKQTAATVMDGSPLKGELVEAHVPAHGTRVFRLEPSSKAKATVPDGRI